MKRTTRILIRDYGITILIAVATALTLRSYLIESYHIPSFSMSPTLLAGDTIFVLKGFFWNRKNQIPNYGDVVIFSPPSTNDTSSPNFVKRVIGLPGDQIEIKNGNLVLNGKALAQKKDNDSLCLQETLPNGKTYPICLESPRLEDFPTTQIPTDSVFVMGDSRGLNQSMNPKLSRLSWGIVPLTSIFGKASWIWLSIQPTTDSSWFPHPRFDRLFKKIE